ncbi:MAG TPA: PfkB family carbohydrate kinase [Candidatus Dormibacteraeota bacterium]|nr:PfkB family carbohydrate kinase [Candidatus Dormibacteraeota bacterium]
MSALLDAAARLAGVRVLVLGDVIADRYQFGAPTRVSREAPVLVLEYSGEATIPGGAANAASNVRSLGGLVELAGVVGDDAEAELLRGQLRTLGVEADGLVVEPGRPTTSKTRIFAGSKTRGQQVVRFDRHSVEALHPETEAALLRHLAALVEGVDAVLISDYGYGALNPALIEAGIGRSAALGRPVVVDSQGDLSRYPGASVATPNLAELEAWAGHRLADLPAVEAACRHLIHRLGAGAVLCTRGGEGMSLITETQAWHLPVARRAEVFDVAGAGDTVAAALTLALGAGVAPPVAALLADCAASVVVQKLGAATCSPSELRAAIDGLDPAAEAAAGL